MPNERRMSDAEPRPARKRARRLALRFGLWGVGLFALLLGAGWWALQFVPLPPDLFAPPPPSVQLVDHHGRPLRELSSTDLVTRRVALAEISPQLVSATLAVEDRRFWDHAGVDARAYVRAAFQLVRHGRVVSGGSTIAQQVIKLAQPRPRTLRTKVIEALQALRLEQIWTRQRILAEYLNRLDYGNLRRGCASAAAFYFGRPVADLGTAEAAFLAGLPQGPSRLNPYRHFDRAKRRQERVLAAMRAAGYLGEAEYRRARREPIRLRPPQRDFAAPHFADLVLQLAADRVATSDGGRLRTTLDLDLNREAERTLREHWGRLQDRNVRQGAVVVIENRTGDVLVLVGSADYFAVDAGQVNGAWAPRSAGSTLKPFTYLLALEQSATPASIVADVPTEFATATGVFAPLNYSRRCHGPTSYRLALANSLNIPAVRVLNDVGGPAVLQTRLQAFGLTTLTQPPDFYGLGLTIGNAEVRLIELANAYASLARLGDYRPFRLLADPAPELEGGVTCQRVADAGAAWLIADMLSDNAARALEFGLDSPLRFDFPVACKTGTSTDFRDNWAFGYTPEFTVGVWVGNFDGTPMQGVSGVTGAAPVLHDLFTHLHQRFGTSWFAASTNVVECLVNPWTGKRLAAARPGAVREKCLAGCLPLLEGADDYDAAGRVRLPAEYAEWFASSENGLAGRAVLASPKRGVERGSPFHVPLTGTLAGAGDRGGTDLATAVATPRVRSPLPGTVFFLDPDLPESGDRVRLQAEADSAAVWQCATLQIESAGSQTFARLTEGRHELVVRDPATGGEARTWIEVRRL